MKQLKFRYWNGSKILNQEAIINHLNKYIARSDKHLMQFTGLLDKQGIEIYEGDLVKFGCDNDSIYSPVDGHYQVYQNLTGMIIFRECNFCITNVPTKFNSLHDNYWLGSKNVVLLEVIGNIYENEELLDD